MKRLARGCITSLNKLCDVGAPSVQLSTVGIELVACICVPHWIRLNELSLEGTLSQIHGYPVTFFGNLKIPAF